MKKLFLRMGNRILFSGQKPILNFWIKNYSISLEEEIQDAFRVHKKKQEYSLFPGR